MQAGIRIATLGAAIVALASCAGQQVKTDYNPEVGFSRYRTFTMVTRPDNVSHQLLDDRVERAVESRLEAKRLREVDRSDADLLVGYGIVNRTHTEVEQTGWGWGPWWHWRWGVPWPATIQQTAYTYTDGTVVVHLVDAKTHRVVWQGQTPDAIDLPVGNPRKSERQVDVAVSKLLAHFPPKAHA
jgi:hypothetical protein